MGSRQRVLHRKLEILPNRVFRLRSNVSIPTLVVLLILTACDVELRKTDAQLGLNPQQAVGRRVYDQYCERCHAPYSSRGRQGPSMKGVFRKQYLSASGLPANDDRVGDIVRYGRNKMPGFGQV